MTKLEEAAREYAENLNQHLLDSAQHCSVCDVKFAFTFGAEWQAKQSPWVSVKEHLPDEQEMVLCMMKSNNAIVSGYIATTSNHKPTVLTSPDFEFEDLMDYEPIAWMSIPDHEED